MEIYKLGEYFRYKGLYDDVIGHIFSFVNFNEIINYDDRKYIIKGVFDNKITYDDENKKSKYIFNKKFYYCPLCNEIRMNHIDDYHFKLQNHVSNFLKYKLSGKTYSIDKTAINYLISDYKNKNPHTKFYHGISNVKII